MRTLFLTTVLAVCASVPAMAQWDPVIEAQGQVLSATARGYAERGYAEQRRRGPTAKQRAACAQKSQLRAQYGAANPGVRRLYQLCRSAGL